MCTSLLATFLGGVDDNDHDELNGIDDYGDDELEVELCAPLYWGPPQVGLMMMVVMNVKVG